MGALPSTGVFLLGVNRNGLPRARSERGDGEGELINVLVQGVNSRMVALEGAMTSAKGVGKCIVAVKAER